MKKDAILARILELKESLNKRLMIINESDRIFSNREWNIQRAVVRSMVRVELRDVFGTEIGANESIKDAGSFEMPYRHGGYEEAVFFGYLAVDGQNPYKRVIRKESAHESVPPRSRDDLFTKGYRWSDKDMKSQFYYYFDLLESIMSADCAPLNYWITKLDNKTGGYLRIIPESLGECSKLGILSIPQHVRPFPDLCSLKNECPFIKFLDTILNLKESNKCGVFKKDLVNGETINKKYSEAWRHFSEHPDHKDQLNKWFSGFREAGLSVDDSLIDKENIFRVVCLYHYQDTPFVMNLFLPTDEEKKIFTRDAWLAISHKVSTTLSDDQIKIAREIINVLSVICTIEDTLERKLKAHLNYFLAFERWYNKRRDEYRDLCDIMTTMFKTICRHENIAINPIMSRVKDTKSLFEKLVYRANGWEKDKKNGHKPESYRDLIVNEKFNQVPEFIRDIAGVRIVCIFNNDVNEITKLIKRLNKKHLITSKPKVHDFNNGQMSSYRSTHITAELYGPRLKLPEMKPLKGLKCEIQIRSTLAHGWADVSHTLDYKINIPKEVLAEIDASMQKDASNLENDLHSVGEALKLNDVAFDRSRDDHKIFTNKYFHE